MSTESHNDPLADDVRAAWTTHTAALATKDDRLICEAFIAVLKAERALEVDCGARAATSRQRANYAASVAEYDARIDDELRHLATRSS